LKDSSDISKEPAAQLSETVQSPTYLESTVISNQGRAKEEVEVPQPSSSVSSPATKDDVITTCQYLRKIGLSDEVTLAIPTPKCTESGSFEATQCNADGECWCVDNFGVEAPNTRNASTPNIDCTKNRLDKQCYGLRCRLGCEYGFSLSKETGCPLCECNELCDSANCVEGTHCEMTPVSCVDGSLMCPSIPLCVPDVLIDEVKFPATCDIGDPLRGSSNGILARCSAETSVTDCPPGFGCTSNPESEEDGVCCPTPGKI
jgi:hypothetical protein